MCDLLAGCARRRGTKRQAGLQVSDTIITHAVDHQIRAGRADKTRRDGRREMHLRLGEILAGRGRLER